MKNRKNRIRKTYLGLFMILFSFMFAQVASAQIDDGEALDFPSEEKIIETAKATVRAYEMGDWETIRRNSTSNAVFYNLGTFDSLDVDQTINYWQKGRETATPVLAEDGSWLPVNIQEGPRKGTWVLHWGNNTLTYPNGETISFPYHVAFKFDGNNVEQVHFYYDNNKIIRGLGHEILAPLSDEDDSEDANIDPDNNEY